MRYLKIVHRRFRNGFKSLPVTAKKATKQASVAEKWEHWLFFEFITKCFNKTFQISDYLANCAISEAQISKNPIMLWFWLLVWENSGFEPILVCVSESSSSSGSDLKSSK